MDTNLQKLLKERHISKEMIQALIGAKSAKTVYNKVYRHSPFTLGEALKIMTIFPEYTLEYVFEGYDTIRADEAAGEEEVA